MAANPFDPIFTVDALGDVDDGNYGAGELTLREAVNLANADPDADTITFDLGDAATIVLDGSELTIASALTLDAEGREITVDAEGQSRVLNQRIADVPLTVMGLTLTGGRALLEGGAIRSSGELTLIDTVVMDSVAQSVYVSLPLRGSEEQPGVGGGIFGEAAVTLIDSVVTGNTASLAGGIAGNTVSALRSSISGNIADGYWSYTSGTVSIAAETRGGGILASDVGLINSTVSGNTSNGFTGFFGSGGAYGGGVYADETTLVNATVTGNATIQDRAVAVVSAPQWSSGGIHGPAVRMFNSVVAGNWAGGTRDDVGGTIVEQVASLVGGDGRLLFADTVEMAPGIYGGVASDNGGPTPTVALLASPDNPALDAGHNDAAVWDGTALAGDQRGETRVADGDGDGVAIVDIGAVEVSALSGALHGGFALAENLPAGTVVGTVSGPAGVALDGFAILRGNAGGHFAIDAASGVITTTTALDHEAIDSYTLAVQAIVDGGGMATGVVDVAVDDVNEPPAFVAPTVMFTLTADAAVGDVVGALSASDPDEGAVLTFPPATLFDGRLALAADGTLTVAQPLTAGTWGPAPVSVSDGEFTASAEVAIDVFEGAAPEPGTILFADDFDSGAWDPAWVTVHPTQWVEDGWLHSKDTDGGQRDALALVHDGDTSWIDYELSLRFDPIETSAPWTRASILLRTDDYDQNSVVLEGSAYRLYFGHHPDGGGVWNGPVNSVTFIKIADGAEEPDPATGTNFKRQVFFDDLGLGPIDLKVRVEGATIDVDVDGADLFEWTDPDPLTHGGIGLHTTWEAETRFDDIVVRALDGDEPTPELARRPAQPGPSEGFTVLGTLASERVGTVVDATGDTNGDGIDDVILAAPGATYYEAHGGGYIIHGRENFSSSEITQGDLTSEIGHVYVLQLNVNWTSLSLAGLGDVNGDGIDNFGMAASSPNQPWPGFVGTTSAFSDWERPIPIVTTDVVADGGFNFIYGDDIPLDSKIIIGDAGDIDKNEYNEVIVGVPEIGAALLVQGKPRDNFSLLNLSPYSGTDWSGGEVVVHSVVGLPEGDEAHYAISTAGDLNGDGIDDFAVGVANADTPGGAGAGAVYVIFGNSDGLPTALDVGNLDGTNGTVIHGGAAGDGVGHAVGAAGDVNGDGYDDLVIGAPFMGPNGVGSGQSFVVFGRPGGWERYVDVTTLDGANGFAIDGEAAGDRSGWSIDGAGDVNDDGIDDLILGAPGVDAAGPDSGRAYVVFGSTERALATLHLSALDGRNGLAFDGMAAGDETGFGVSAAGDVNDDGVADLLVGAPGSDANGVEAGAAYVHFGTTEAGTVPPQPPGPVPTDGLVAWYPFNGDAEDETGNGYDGTLKGDIQLTADRTGAPDSAFAFDGVDDYIDLGRSLNVPAWNDYTVSAWFLNDYDGAPIRSYGQKIIDKTTWFSDFYISLSWEDREDPATLDRLVYQTYDNGSGSTFVDDELRDGDWHHVAITRASSHGELWLDGELVGTADNIKTVDNDQPLLIGYSVSGDGFQRTYWDGALDDFRIYDRALDAEEIAALADELEVPSVGDEVTVALVGAKAGADFTNLVGWYDTATGEAAVLFADAAAAVGAVATVAVPDAERLGLFLVPDGGDDDFLVDGAFAGRDPRTLDLRVVEQDGRWVVATADGTALEGRPVHGGAAEPLAWFTEAAKNPDGIAHVDAPGTGVLGFEDLFGGGDRDFNDVVLRAGTPVAVTLDGAAGSFANLLGWYDPLSGAAELLVTDPEAESGTTVELLVPDPARLEFFVVPDGGDGFAPGGRFAGEDPTDLEVAVVERGGAWLVETADGRLLEGRKYGSTGLEALAYFSETAKNPDGARHFAAAGERLGVEDFWQGGDNDFDDLVLTVDLAPDAFVL